MNANKVSAGGAVRGSAIQQGACIPSRPRDTEEWRFDVAQRLRSLREVPGFRRGRSGFEQETIKNLKALNTALSDWQRVITRVPGDGPRITRVAKAIMDCEYAERRMQAAWTAWSGVWHWIESLIEHGEKIEASRGVALTSHVVSMVGTINQTSIRSWAGVMAEEIVGQCRRLVSEVGGGRILGGSEVRRVHKALDEMERDLMHERTRYLIAMARTYEIIADVFVLLWGKEGVVEYGQARDLARLCSLSDATLVKMTNSLPAPRQRQVVRSLFEGVQASEMFRTSSTRIEVTHGMAAMSVHRMGAEGRGDLVSLFADYTPNEKITVLLDLANEKPRGLVAALHKHPWNALNHLYEVLTDDRIDARLKQDLGRALDKYMENGTGRDIGGVLGLYQEVPWVGEIEHDVVSDFFRARISADHIRRMTAEEIEDGFEGLTGAARVWLHHFRVFGKRTLAKSIPGCLGCLEGAEDRGALITDGVAVVLRDLGRIVRGEVRRSSDPVGDGAVDQYVSSALDIIGDFCRREEALFIRKEEVAYVLAAVGQSNLSSSKDSALRLIEAV